MTQLPEYAAGKGKVLVIEDDTLTRRTICSTLQKHNHSTVEACNGFMGLIQFKRELPDVVITDLMMPDKGGLETIYEMRAVNPAVKIIAMTGGVNGDTSSYLELAEEVGAMYKITKPFTPEQLLTVLAAAKTA